MSAPQLNASEIEQQLLVITQSFLVECERYKSAEKLTLQTDLTREAGVDSLGRVELFHRFEQVFGIMLSQDLMVGGKCLADFVPHILTAKPQKCLSPIDVPVNTLDKIADHQLPTLTEGFLHLSEKVPEQVQTQMFIDGLQEPLTYQNMRLHAEKICGFLQSEGIQPGDTVAIMLPSCKEFFYTFLGIQLAGAVPVPIYPPLRPEMIEEYALREAKILESAGVRILITFDRAQKLSNMLGILIHTLRQVVNVSDVLKTDFTAKIHKNTPDSPGLIQYTSGSTSLPKGVLLKHGNLVANIHAIKETIKLNHTDMGITWLPLYHDMGLIGNWLNSMYHGIPIVVMSPLDFLVRPESWLWAIHHFRGTLSAAPNFAYELCIKKIPDDRLQGLDLSSWRLAFNGAEAVRPNTLRNFYQRFSPFGLSDTSIFPVYGLAENCVALTAPKVGSQYVTDKIDKNVFEIERVATPAKEGAPFLEFVNCGEVIVDHLIRVVNSAGAICPDRVIGTLQFSGPSQMAGYYNNDAATQKCLTEDGWIDTGDLAYLVKGSLYIVGRLKDIIIKAGRNYYPEEIEDIVSNVRGVRKGCIVAFSVQNEQLGTEQMVIVAESRVKHGAQKRKIANEIMNKVTIALGIAPDDIIVARPKSVPKTSSGKLQRAKCKQWYVDGDLGKRRLPIVAQIIKIWAKTVSIRLRQCVRCFASVVYTLYANILVACAGILFAISSMILPKSLNIRFIKSWLKFNLLILGISPQFTAPKEWPKGILVSNHQSYIDAAVLYSILPSNVEFVGKSGLQKVPILHYICRKIGVHFVDREHAGKSLTDLKHIEGSNQSLLFFPEGTFGPQKGVLPFKMGAFEVAAKSSQDIIPIALYDTREVLRGGKWLMWPHRIKVELFNPVVVTSSEWSDLLQAEKHVRKLISEAVNEPLLP